MGVNKYTEGADMEVELHEYNEATAAAPDRTPSKTEGDKGQQGSHSHAEGSGKGGEEEKNVMPYLVDCCKAYANGGRNGQCVQGRIW